MKLFQQITPNTILITPNRRLSAATLKKYHDFQVKNNKSCWTHLDVLPLSAWIRKLWNDFSFTQIAKSFPIILSTNQETLLWEVILQQSEESGYLLQCGKAAELAKSAWGLLKQWRVDFNHPDFALTEDSSVFQKWANQFQQFIQQHNWLDADSLTDVVIEKIKSRNISVPEKIILLGFTEIAPLHQYLFSICEQNGSQVVHHQPDCRTESVQRIGLLDEETEIRSMARFAKSLLDNNPTAEKKLIACVVPRLEKCRHTVSRIFSEVFAEKNQYTLNTISPAFNISAGKSLLDYPVIHTAIQLLNLSDSNISIELFSTLLHSPFLGEGDKEMLKRAEFENQLKRDNIISIEIEKLMAEKSQHDFSSTCPLLAKRFKKMLEFRSHFISKMNVSEWTTLFMQQLTLLGWPGERSLNSTEYQAVQRFLELLSEFSSFDAILQPQKYQEALHFLTRLTSKTIFQPQSPDAPVQILGVLEAVDLPFDYLWLMGMNDAEWPPAPKPNPFIPHKLQKSLHMPHATAERELLFCQHLISQLKNSAAEVIFSYPLKTAESELRASSLIETIPEIQLESLMLSEFISPAESIYHSRLIELINDDQAPAFTLDQVIRGGTQIFKLQGACPFRAFTELRLNAKKLESSTLGLRAQDRGMIMHKALEFIWKELRSSENLEALNEIELNELIDVHAEKALSSFVDEKNFRYFKLEKQRLKKILLEWMQLEKTRPSFKVLSQEKEHTINIGNIPVKLRVDRIDELSNGKKLIIDYKTGKNNHIKDWFGERPNEPQLPLYCIIDPDNTGAIAFAELHPDKMELKGVSQKDIEMKSFKILFEVNGCETKTWSQQIIDWQTALEKIGNDFFQGNAKADPKDPNETCRYCHLHAVCRIDEKNHE